jgi:hypothetical protein
VTIPTKLSKGGNEILNILPSHLAKRDMEVSTKLLWAITSSKEKRFSLMNNFLEEKGIK